MPDEIIIALLEGSDVTDEEIDQIANQFKEGETNIQLQGKTIIILGSSNVNLTSEQIDAIANAFKNRLIQSVSVNRNGVPIIIKKICP